MDYRHMVGHRFLLSLPGPAIDEVALQLIRDYKVSNFILMPQNIENPQQLSLFLLRLQELVMQETGHPALIAIDQEGGTVTRMPAGATHMPGAMALASTHNPARARQAAYTMAVELAAMGVNFDLAPVLDINNNPLNPVIGERSFGDTADTVIRYGLAAMEGLAEGGVLACAKHFPGHGDTHVDSHLALPTVDKSIEALRKCELVPFQAAIDAGIDAIMSSHILMPALDPGLVPNTLSRRVMTDLLRTEMGFRGLSVSDCLRMNAISKTVGTPRGAVMAAQAGVDLLCICHTPEIMIQSIQTVEDELKSGAIDREENERSVERILSYKKIAMERMRAAGAELSQVGCQAHRELARQIRSEAICLAHAPAGNPPLPALGSHPLFVGCRAFRSTIASKPKDGDISFSGIMAEQFGGVGITTGIDPDEAEIERVLREAKTSSCIVASSYNGQHQNGQRELIRRLSALPVPLVHIAMRTPYDLSFSPAHVWKIAAFDYSVECFDVLAEILGGRRIPSGRLSVTLP